MTARDYTLAHRRRPVRDRLIADVRRYLRLRELGGSHMSDAANAFPSIHQAFELQANPRLVNPLRMMILGGLDEAEILRRIGQDLKTVADWGKIFFDVDLQKDSLSWHVNHIVRAEQDHGNPQLAAKLHTARIGGPSVTRELLDGPAALPTTPEGQLALIRRQVQLASMPLLLLPAMSRDEMWRMLKLSCQQSVAAETSKLAKGRQAARDAKQAQAAAEAERRLRVAEQRAKEAAARRAAQENEKLQRAAQEQELLDWRCQQNKLQAEKEHAECLARAAASPLSGLTWGSATRKVANAAAEPRGKNVDLRTQSRRPSAASEGRQKESLKKGPVGPSRNSKRGGPRVNPGVELTATLSS